MRVVVWIYSRTAQYLGKLSGTRVGKCYVDKTGILQAVAVLSKVCTGRCTSLAPSDEARLALEQYDTAPRPEAHIAAPSAMDVPYSSASFCVASYLHGR
jgi:hypothetical protein